MGGSERRTSREHYREVNEATQRWQRSALADLSAGADLANGLLSWLADQPHEAESIELLATSGCHTAALNGAWRLVGNFADVGIDAATLLVADQARSDRKALLGAALAEASIHLGARLPLQRGKAYMADYKIRQGQVQNQAPATAMSAFVDIRSELVTAHSFESALEWKEAVVSYRRAALNLTNLMVSRLDELTDSVVRAYWGDLSLLADLGIGGLTKDAHDFIGNELHRILTDAHAGSARCSNSKYDARSTMQTIASKSLPRTMLPFELRPIVLSLPVQEALAAARTLEDLAEKAFAHNGQLANSWRCALRSTAAVRLHRSGDERGAMKEYGRSVETANAPVERRTGVQWMLDYLAVMDPKSIDIELVEAVITGISLAIGDADSADAATLRQQYDDGVKACIRTLLDRDAFQTRRGRTLLTAAIDALRDPRPLPAHLLTSTGRIRALAELAMDVPSRLRAAMESHIGTIAVLEECIGAETWFVWATGGPGAQLCSARAGAVYGQSLLDLNSELTAQIESDQPDDDADERLAELGRELWSVLPAALRDALIHSETVLVAADPLAPGGGIPLEILHDGESFLALSKIISRARSMMDLVMILEPAATATPDSSRRVLLLAADQPPDWPELPAARAEVVALDQRFRSVGWDVASDVAEVDGAALTAGLLLEGAEYCSLVHIAGHGETIAGQQAFIMPSGALFVLDDIDRRPRAMSSCWFVNACSIGASRSAGAGIDRGLASALRRAGAPLVIANVGPVIDEVGTELALTFYEAAMEQTAGEALRAARRGAAAAGRPVAEWAVVIMLGNPDHRLAATVVADAEVDTVLAPVFQGRGAPPAAQENTDPRLAAAIQWARIAVSSPDPNEIEELAQLGPILGHTSCAAWARVQQLDDSDSPLDVRLDRALDALEPVRHQEFWRATRTRLLGERNRLRPGVEPPFFVTDAGLSVNDRSDPAVAAVLNLQRVVDEEEIRREGPQSLIPDHDEAAFARNCVTIGQCARFTAIPAREASVLLGCRANQILPGTARPRRGHLLSALMPLLWDQQRMTHLESERAAAQTGVVQYLLSRVGAAWPNQTTRLAAALDNLQPPSTRRPGSTARFTDVLQLLDTSAPSPIGVVRELLFQPTDAAAGIDEMVSRLQSIGLVLERAAQFRRAGQTALATQLDAAAENATAALGDMVSDLTWKLSPNPPNVFLARWRSLTSQGVR